MHLQLSACLSNDHHLIQLTLVLFNTDPFLKKKKYHKKTTTLTVPLEGFGLSLSTPED